jgi:hypothetical protein
LVIALLHGCWSTFYPRVTLLLLEGK